MCTHWVDQWIEAMEAVTSKYTANSLDVYVVVFF